MAVRAPRRILGRSAWHREQENSPDARLMGRMVVGTTIGSVFVLGAVVPVFLMVGATFAGVTCLAYLIVNLVMLAVFASGRLGTHPFVATQMVLVIVGAFLTCVGLGGIANSGGALFYGFIAPLAGVLVFGTRAAVVAFGGFLVSIVVAGLLAALGINTPVLPHATELVLLSFNTTALGMFVLATIAYFVAQRNRAYRSLEIEEGRTEALLLNILPASIAAQMKAGETRIARHHDAASILFADVTNFTPLAAKLSPDDVVDLLNDVFTEFDRLVEKYGLEKIKTIGDAYMVAAGVPEPRDDHALAITHLALDMMNAAEAHRFKGHELVFRIGINSGPVVAGIIGERKFSYDLWGDTVNTASRLEEYGIPGRIQISQETQRLIADSFDVELRGQLDVKGKGLVTTYLLSRPEPKSINSETRESGSVAPAGPGRR